MKKTHMTLTTFEEFVEEYKHRVKNALDFAPLSETMKSSIIESDSMKAKIVNDWYKFNPMQKELFDKYAYEYDMTVYPLDEFFDNADIFGDSITSW